jgi:hypothetical protein
MRGHVTPYDVYTGNHFRIIEKRNEVRRETLEARRAIIKPPESRGMPLSAYHFIGMYLLIFAYSIH